MTTETQSAISELAQMLATMERASVQGTNAFTSRELMQHLNVGEKRCLVLIRRGLEAGSIRVCRKTITDLVGRPITVPAYERAPNG